MSSNPLFLGNSTRPLRVAVIGSGPAGFYTVQHLFNTPGLTVECDVFDQLPTPFGLVRFGVAPDHQKTKKVVKVFQKLAAKENFRFFGNVEYGKDISLADLKQFYHCVIFATGAQASRRIGIPGEDLTGSYAATEFVAWYNGHPDYSDRKFDLTHPVAVIVGMGNVSIDVARILSSTTEELETTDIADYALEALRNSGVKHVYILGRRGPAQAAFSNPELSELERLTDTEVHTPRDELAIDEHTRSAAANDHTLSRKLEILTKYAEPISITKPRRITIRFLSSPLELISGQKGQVTGVQIAHNELSPNTHGIVQAQQTEKSELIEAGLVLRSIGYKGIPLANLPFLEDQGIVPNDQGRVIEPTTGNLLRSVYVSGWIKRGPHGVIGTNKNDAKQTIKSLVADLRQDIAFRPHNLAPENIDKFLKDRGVRYVSYGEWQNIDKLETDLGLSRNRPRVKLTSRRKIFEALENTPPPDP